MAGFAWDGKACEAIECKCKGKDCGSIYMDDATCEKAHVSCGTTTMPGGCANEACGTACILPTDGVGFCDGSGNCLPMAPPCSANPCSGKMCGDACSTCDGSGPCPQIVEFCDIDGKCVPEKPMCTFN